MRSLYFLLVMKEEGMPGEKWGAQQKVSKHFLSVRGVGGQSAGEWPTETRPLWLPITARGPAEQLSKGSFSPQH